MPATLEDPDEEEGKKDFKALDEGDIALLKQTYGLGPYNKKIPRSPP